MLLLHNSPLANLQGAAVGAQEVFGMESSVPLNIFMLGIGPTINAGLLLNFWQCLPFAPGYQHLKKLRQQGQEVGPHVQPLHGACGWEAIAAYNWILSTSQFICDIVQTLPASAWLGYKVRHSGVQTP